MLSVFAFCLFGQTGKIKDDLTVPSKILKMDRKYAVYLPPITKLPSVVIPYYTCCMEQVMIRPDGYNLVKF